MGLRWLLALLLFSGVVRADDQKRAQQLSADGMTHYNAARYREAIAAFGASYELRPLPILLFNIGQAHRLSGDCESALNYYRRYLAQAPAATNRPLVERLMDECRFAPIEPAAPPPDLGAPPDLAPPAVAAPPVAAPPVAAPLVAAPAVVLVAPPPKPTPVYRRWWLWTAVGGAAAVVALGVGLGVGLSAGPPSPSLGVVTWTPR